MSNFQIINPLHIKFWDEKILEFYNNSFFHSQSWAKVLYETYNYKPIYIVSKEDGEITDILPFFDINSIITGKRGVSIPFTDVCNRLIKTNNNYENIIDFLQFYGQKRKWKYFEIRGDFSSKYVLPSQSYFIHLLNLNQELDIVFNSFRENHKRNIKKAESNGVKINRQNSWESTKKFYYLNCFTRKKHGLPPQPYIFFEKLYEHIISREKGLIINATYNSQVIASAIFFIFGKKIIYKYGASDISFQNFRPNNLLFWEAIKFFTSEGYSELNFGKTHPKSSGLKHFKIGFGTNEYLVNYYKYVFKTGEFIKEDSNEFGVHNKIFSQLPVSALKIIGNTVYRHFG